MQVTFPPPYEGQRLVVYRSEDPERESCISVESGRSGCTVAFVGALAVVVYTVQSMAGRESRTTSIREVVTLVDQSPGLPDRPQFAMSIRLINGVGSDLQAFGYDESAAPPAERANERAAAKAAWRRYRQELYLDSDRQPFAIIEWLHTMARIYMIRLDTPSSLTKRTRECPPKHSPVHEPTAK